MIYLGRLSPRHGTWSRRRRARNGGVSHPSGPLKSHLQYSLPACPGRSLRPGQPWRLHPPLSCTVCPGCAGPCCAVLCAALAGLPQHAWGSQAPGARRPQGAAEGRAGAGPKGRLFFLSVRCVLAQRSKLATLAWPDWYSHPPGRHTQRSDSRRYCPCSNNSGYAS